MEENKKKESLPSLIAAIIITIGGMILGGLVLRNMWAWFLVPIHVPPIGTAQAIGISMIGSLITTKFPTHKSTGEEFQSLPWAVGIVLTYLIFWGMAAIVHLFM